MDEKDLNYLKSEGYPDGLIHAMGDLKRNCAKQIWLIDNSESMKEEDGHVLTNDSHAFQNCTRWEELTQCVRSHVQLSAAFNIPTSFRLLNADPNLPSSFEICGPNQQQDDESKESQVQKGLDILSKAKPHGTTPLTEHFLSTVAEEIDEMGESLQNSGKHVSIIVATDGASRDSTKEFLLHQVNRLDPHKVHLVVRLCTDDPKVVDFFNTGDQKDVKIPFDVLVDFQAEAVEVCKVNPWLNYALPIHRAREMGFNSQVLDLLDEKALTQLERQDMCTLLFGKTKMARGPGADQDWEGFVDHIKVLLEEEKLHWDPIEEEMKPWVDFGLLEDPKEKLSKMRKIKNKKTLRWFTGGILGN